MKKILLILLIACSNILFGQNYMSPAYSQDTIGNSYTSTYYDNYYNYGYSSNLSLFYGDYWYYSLFSPIYMWNCYNPYWYYNTRFGGRTYYWYNYNWSFCKPYRPFFIYRPVYIRPNVSNIRGNYTYRTQYLNNHVYRNTYRPYTNHSNFGIHTTIPYSHSNYGSHSFGGGIHFRR